MKKGSKKDNHSRKYFHCIETKMKSTTCYTVGTVPTSIRKITGRGKLETMNGVTPLLENTPVSDQYWFENYKKRKLYWTIKCKSNELKEKIQW